MLQQGIKLIFGLIPPLTLGILCVVGLALVFGSPPTLLAENGPHTLKIEALSQVFSNTVFAPETVNLERVPSINSPEYNRSAVLLPDGHILFAGGGDAYSANNWAELFDGSNNTLVQTVGNLHGTRYGHTSIKLPNGQVLISGGFRRGGTAGLQTAELYNPATGTFTFTEDMSYKRDYHTTTMLPTGKVLIAGGAVYDGPPSSELYDPATGTFTVTNRLNFARQRHSATLLPNGQVLIAGGRWQGGGALKSAELYDPITEKFTVTGQMQEAREFHATILLTNGKVLLASGTTTELYDWQTGTFTYSDNLQISRDRYATLSHLPNGRVMIVGGFNADGATAELYNTTTGTFSDVLYPLPLEPIYTTYFSGHTATELPDGQVLLTGGRMSTYRNNKFFIRAKWLPENTFTGSFTLPLHWVNGNVTIGTAYLGSETIQLSGSASNATVNAASLKEASGNWGDWIPIQEGSPITVSWLFQHQGHNQPFYLRLRDENGHFAQIVTGTVNVDTIPPISSLAPLPQTSNSSIPLTWSGTDNVSGLTHYDLQVRPGLTGTWTPLVTATTQLSMTYQVEEEQPYYFRIRAHDLAGNIELWPDTHDTFTLVDTHAPTGTLIINHGALATTSADVILSITAVDSLGILTDMRFSDDTNWQSWIPITRSMGPTLVHTQSMIYSLPSGDGPKTIYLQFRDEAGNITSSIPATIRLDESAGMDTLASINNGRTWANTSMVSLTIGAPANTIEMQLSNDGGFSNAVWQPYDSRPTWQIEPFGSYVIPRVIYVRVRGPDNVASAPYSDDIIYDPIAPNGQVEITSISTSQVTVNLNANDPDNLSGVAEMKVALIADFENAGWTPYNTNATLPLPNTDIAPIVKAQFRDRAGNTSAIYYDGLIHSLFLPLIAK